MTKNIFVPYIGAFGGVERLILSLSRFLDQQAIEHKIVCFSDTINLETYAQWPVKIQQLHPPRRSLSEARAIKQHCRSLAGPDWLLFDLKGAFYAGLANLKDYHLHLTDPPSLLAGESSRFSRKYRKWSKDVPGATWLRCCIGEVVQLVNRRGVRRARTVIAMTNRIANEIEGLYTVTPQVIRPGVTEVVKQREPKHGVRDTMTMLSVSRLEASKRIDLAIDAIAELSEQRNNHGIAWQLEIAGNGPARTDLEMHAQKRGVSQRVRFLGRVSDEDLEKAFQQADLFVMPAVQGYGLPALEALQRGVPVVLHQESGVSEILGDSLWTEIIDRNDQLTVAIQRLGERIRTGELSSAPPTIPTDYQWAEQIAHACSWL